MRKLRIQWARSNGFHVGFKKPELKDKDERLALTGLLDRVEHTTASATEMSNWLEELKERLVVQDDAFHQRLQELQSEAEDEADAEDERADHDEDDEEESDRTDDDET